MADPKSSDEFCKRERFVKIQNKEDRSFWTFCCRDCCGAGEFLSHTDCSEETCLEKCSSDKDAAFNECKRSTDGDLLKSWGCNEENTYCADLGPRPDDLSAD